MDETFLPPLPTEIIHKPPLPDDDFSPPPLPDYEIITSLPPATGDHPAPLGEILPDSPTDTPPTAQSPNVINASLGYPGAGGVNMNSYTIGDKRPISLIDNLPSAKRSRMHRYGMISCIVLHHKQIMHICFI